MWDMTNDANVENMDCSLMGLDFAKKVGIFSKAIGLLWQK